MNAVSIALIAICSRVQAQEAAQTLHKHVRSEITAGKAELVGTLAPDQRLNFAIVLPLRNQAQLTSLLSRLYDPASPDYRHFLSVAQFTAEFGPTTADYQKVLAFARANGFTVTGTPANRLVVPLNGTASQIGSAFHLSMNLYRHPTEDRVFYSPDREPTLDLSVAVRHISGLNNFSIPHPLLAHQQSQAAEQAVAGSGPSSSYLGSDMRTAYYGGTTLTGNGQAVGLLEFGGYDINDVNLSFSNAGQTYSVPVNNVLLDGATIQTSSYDAEQVLDIVQAIGMAPGLSQVRVYIGEGQDDANVLNTMASENIAKELSSSWSWQPEDAETDDVFFQEFAAQGQSFFAASGDSGAYDAAISPFFYPSEDVYVTSVGGTHLTTNGPGGTWASESAWNSVNGGITGGSGGGISPDQIAIPSWQTPAINSTNGGSLVFRNDPDVAMEADFDNFYCGNGYCSPDGAGTSFAAPRWAGFMALVNQQAVEAGNAPAGGIGFLNPSFYTIGASAKYGKDFHDITAGNNDTGNQPVWFNAVTGYDLVTGWGSATGQSLIDDLAGKQVPGFWLAASAPTVSLLQGGTASTTINITDAANFSGSVTLAITSALPAGVTASWGTNPTTGSSTLTLKASASVAASVTTVTITGTSGKLTATTNITVAVHVPTFAVSISPGSLQIATGASATSSITVTPEYGFTGNVTLSASGLPSGLTASFSPNPTAGTSTVTFSTSATTPGGTYPIRITGTGGGQSASSTLSVTVAAPTFTVYTSGNLNIGQGTSGSLSVSVYAQFGFTGNVNFSVSGLPSGVTASFAPNPITQSQVSTLTLTASPTASLGNATLTITGTSGTITRTATTTLGVYVPTFTLQSLGTITVGQGTTAQTQISVMPLYGFDGSVNLSIAGQPSGVTASLTPNPVTQYATLVVSASSSAALGNSTLTITGTSGNVSSAVTVPVSVKTPTFTISGSTSMSLGQGTSAIASFYVNQLYGFTGSANLSVSGLPSGVTASFSPNPTSGTSQLTLTAGSSAPTGTYTVTITGTCGSQTASTTMALSLAAPSFTVATTQAITVGQGSSSQTYVSIGTQNGFAGSVNLTASGLPSGVTASFSLNPSLNSSSLIFTASSTAVAGTSTISVTGTSGSLKSTTTLQLTVAAPSFLLSTSSNVTLGQGSTTTAYAYINPQNGFSKNVTLSLQGLPSGLTASFSTNPVVDSSTITFTASNSLAPGNYPLTLTGTSGSLTQTSAITLTIAAPSFTIATYSGPISLAKGGTQTAYFYISPLNGFNGTVSLTASGLPAGVTASFTPNPTMDQAFITLTASSTAAVGTSTITVTGTSGTQSSTTAFSLMVSGPSFSLSNSGDLYISPGAANTAYIYLSPAFGFSGNVSLSLSGLPSGVTGTFSANPITTNSNTALALTVGSATVTGDYTITVKGTSGSLTATTPFVLHVGVPAFSLYSDVNNIALGRGGSATADIFTNWQYGTSSGSVAFAVTGLPSGVTASFSPNPSTGGYAILTLQASSTAALGQYNLKVSGKAGSVTQTVELAVTVGVPSFTLSSNDSPTIGQGTSQTTNIFLQAVDGFTGNVSLSISGLPSGVTASFAPNPVSITGQGASATLNLTASSTAALGQYTVTITGTSGTQTATSNMTLGVYAPSFSLGYGTLSANVGQGGTISTYLFLNQQYGFTGNVTLTTTGLPSGVTASFSANPATTSSIMTITAAGGVIPGQYQATITGTSGKLTASVPLILTVSASTFTVSTYGNLDVGRGGSATVYAYINSQNGFSGNVTLSLAGLPNGVTASVSPNPASSATSAAITLTASSSAPLGEYPIMLIGKSGTTTVTNEIIVNVHAPTFSFTAQNVTLGQGTSGNSSIWLTPQYGFTGNVTFSLSGLPSGVTASISPNPTASSPSLVLTASSTATLGEYPVTITGTSGSQTVSTIISVGIYQPTFSLVSYSGVTLDQGTASTAYISIDTQYGFAGNISLAATGLPNGVTAQFSANPAAAGSGAVNLILTAAVNAPLGQYNVIVTGSSGAMITSTTIPLTVQAAPPVTYPVSFSPLGVTFPSTVIGRASSAQYVTLFNSGNAPLTIKSFVFSGANASEFSISQKSCGTSLPAYQTCQLVLVFQPTTVGAATATLTATDNATNSPQSIGLSGTGTKVAASLQPSSLAFPATPVGETSAPLTATLTNPGGLPLVLNSVTFAGSKNQFTLVSNNCGSSLASKASCSVQVAFSPTTPGNVSDTLEFVDDAGNTPQLLPVGGIAANSALTVSPASLTFPATTTGSLSAPQTTTLTNPGAIALSMSSFTFSGTNSGEFLLYGKTCTTTLAAGASCTLQIAFKPTIAGVATATLTATDNAGNSPQTIPLSGSTPTGPAAVTLSPSSLAFPATSVGVTSAVKTVTFTNPGTIALTVKSFTFSGANAGEFLIYGKTCTTTLAAGASCTLQIAFKPTAAGTAAATLTATDNAGNSPQTVSLSGSTP